MVKHLWPLLQHFSIIPTFALQTLDKLSGTLLQSQCFTHHSANGGKSACGYFRKKNRSHRPCKANSVGGNCWCSSCVFSSVSHPCCLPKPALSSHHLLLRICEKAFAKLSQIPTRMSNPVTEKANKEPEEHEGNRKIHWLSVDWLKTNPGTSTVESRHFTSR